jgi:uncharacterized repeat protein (TIGR01451 family)
MLIDDLTNVLDNGSYLGGASATITPTPAGTVPAPTKAGNRILWSGPLAKGSTVTVIYQVRLTAPSNPAATPTDEGARNIAFLAPGGSDGSTPAPTACAAPTCAATSTPVGGTATKPAPLVSKTVEGATDGVVHPGDELTYVVTLKNLGDAHYTDADPATLVDDILDVVDVIDLAAVDAAGNPGVRPDSGQGCGADGRQQLGRVTKVTVEV